MSQSTPCEAAMTCLNPHAHRIRITSSQTWDWIACSPRPRQLGREVRKRYRWLRWHAAEIRRGATAKTMRESLDQMRARLPFAVTAIQVDGGSEFRAEFETYCQEEGIRLFTLPPGPPN